METNPNQKTVTVQKETCDKQHLYSMYNLEAQQYAMIDLKGETLKMWFYLGKNQKGYTFALSKVDAIKWGIGSKSSYDRAVKELIEKGYLVETGKNQFDFYEMPPKVEEDIMITIRG